MDPGEYPLFSLTPGQLEVRLGVGLGPGCHGGHGHWHGVTVDSTQAGKQLVTLLLSSETNLNLNRRHGTLHESIMMIYLLLRHGHGGCQCCTGLGPGTPPRPWQCPSAGPQKGAGSTGRQVPLAGPYALPTGIQSS